MEYLDQVDINGNVIGKAKRSEFHSNPNIIHQVVHSWIFNSQGQILWQQRSLSKDTAPGLWDMSLGGHVLSDKTPEERVKQEAMEELGISDVEFHFVKKYLMKYETQSELINLYYAIVDISEDLFILQKEEVERVEWIKIEDAYEMIMTHKREATDWIFSQVPIILTHLAFRK